MPAKKRTIYVNKDLLKKNLVRKVPKFREGGKLTFESRDALTTNAMILTNRAADAVNRGNYATAKKQYQQIIRIWERLGNQKMKKNSLKTLKSIESML